MEKIIRLSIENTTKIRQVEDSFCELYSHDKNNGAFEFEILKGTLTNENVVALFKFLRSGSYWKTTGSVEDNKIKFNFDTSLITQNEEVVCYIYLDKEERNSDIFRFKFKVNLSEIDKASQLPVKERFFANSMIVDRVDVLTREVLNEEIKTLKETFVNNETLPRLVEDELNKKNLITEHQDISNLATKDAVDEVAKKVTKLEERPSYDDSDVKQRLTALEGANFLTEHQDISNLATKKSVEDVEAKVTQLEARPSYDDSEIKRKIKELEDRPVTANIDTSNFVTTTQLEDKHYLTEHQDIKGLATKEELRKAFLDDEDHEKYAKKTELPQPYNDTDIANRLTALENRPSGSGNVDTSDFVTKDDLNKQDFLNNTLDIIRLRDAFSTSLMVKLDKSQTAFKFTENRTAYEFSRIERAGKVDTDFYGKVYYNTNERKIYKGFNEFVDLDAALYTLAKAFPDYYVPDYEFGESDSIKLITNKNIGDYINKDALRYIVKEIMKEK